MNVLEPILDQGFHPHSFACRQGKGTHAAADRLQQLLGQYRYFIPCDVTKFFPSIDHDILKSLVRRKVKCHSTLALIDRIVDTSNDQDSPLHYFPGDHLFTLAERRRGLPIGNLTSQWFANLYLDGLDHFVTARLGFGGYVRYCDDFVLLGNDKAKLHEAFARVVEYTAGLRLKLHETRAVLRPSACGVTFVGFRIWPTHRFLTKDNIRKFRRRLRWMKRAFAEGRLTLFEVNQRVASWLGHAINANSYGLIEKLLPEFQWFHDHPLARPE
jgi:RNA-directed DNA polymerase